MFLNATEGELTYNQKNLMIWSQMYDNIQETLDCPSKEVIEDDDILDRLESEYEMWKEWQDEDEDEFGEMKEEDGSE